MPRTPGSQFAELCMLHYCCQWLLCLIDSHYSFYSTGQLRDKHVIRPAEFWGSELTFRVEIPSWNSEWRIRVENPSWNSELRFRVEITSWNSECRIRVENPSWNSEFRFRARNINSQIELGLVTRKFKHSKMSRLGGYRHRIAFQSTTTFFNWTLNFSNCGLPCPYRGDSWQWKWTNLCFSAVLPTIVVRFSPTSCPNTPSGSWCNFKVSHGFTFQSANAFSAPTPILTGFYIFACLAAVGTTNENKDGQLNWL